MLSNELIRYSVQVLGWLGTTLFIVSYVQLNRGVWTLKETKYHIYNILGSLFLMIDTLYDFSFAAATVNFFWGVIAIYGLLRYKKIEKASTGQPTSF